MNEWIFLFISISYHTVKPEYIELVPLGTGKICSLWRRFLISWSFSIYFTITRVKYCGLHYIEVYYDEVLLYITAAKKGPHVYLKIPLITPLPLTCISDVVAYIEINLIFLLRLELISTATDVCSLFCNSVFSLVIIPPSPSPSPFPLFDPKTPYKVL